MAHCAKTFLNAFDFTRSNTALLAVLQAISRIPTERTDESGVVQARLALLPRRDVHVRARLQQHADKRELLRLDLTVRCSVARRSSRNS